MEWRTRSSPGERGLIWITDASTLNPKCRLIDRICCLAPGIGVAHWREFEPGGGWTNVS